VSTLRKVSIKMSFEQIQADFPVQRPLGLCTDYTLNGLVFESFFQSGTWQKKSRHTSFLGHAKI
jgi:hypothetical protein